MDDFLYDARRTALLFIDPYNDFLAEGGKVWPAIQAVAQEVNLLDNLRAIDRAVRAAGVQRIVVPHRRWQEGDYGCWCHPSPTQRLLMTRKTFAKGTWGGEWHPDFAPQGNDIVAHEHWASSGFANTDLDLVLKQHGISHVIVVGLLANTCVETTARYAQELGYHVTLVKDATAAFKREMMVAAHELNGPTYAHRIVATSDLVQALAPKA
jgi:nicotinamidase-related amidase